MIYDCLYFYDELEVLELRLNILNDFVDKFVIVEACKGFNGNFKEFIFEKNKSRFEKFLNKIVYYKIEDFNNKDLLSAAHKSPNTGSKEHFWITEFYIKENLNFAINNLLDNDIIFVSDCDEIWNPQILNIEIKNDVVYRPHQKNLVFYVNILSDLGLECFTGTRFANYKTFKKFGANHFRTEREAKSVLVKDGGWHFSCLTQTTNRWETGHPDDNVRFGKAKLSKHTLIDNKLLPNFLIKEKNKYEHLFYTKK